MVNQNPDYAENDPNYVRVRVFNKGIDTSQEESMFLYWTWAGTGEIWDYSWLDPEVTNNWFVNDDSSESYPMGGTINDAAIVIPPLAPGDSIILNHAWYPPNPDWYYQEKGGQKVYSDRINVCLLARIEKCDDYPHKMEIDEVFNKHVSENVKNNNNIVTRNTWVVDVDKENTPRKSPFTRFGNYLPTNEVVDFGFDIKDSTVREEYEVKLYFDDDIWNAWTFSGSDGTGFQTIPGQNAVTVTSDIVRMNGFELDGFEMGFIQVEFDPIDTNNLTEGEFNIVLAQYRLDSLNPEGGVILTLNVDTSSQTAPPPPPFMEEESNLEEDKPLVEWSTQPNPAETGVEVIFNLKTRRFIEIEVYDALGRKLTSKERSRYRKGTNKVAFDVHDWPTGVYFVHFKYDMYYDAKRLIIQRDQ